MTDNKKKFFHRRTGKRILTAKRKARSELQKCGWRTSGYSDFDSVGKNYKLLPDNILRVDASNLTVKQFIELYEKPGIPVILTGITTDWPANKKWTVERLYRKYRNQSFKCGEDDEGYSVKLKMKYYIDYMLNTQDDSPLYIFDSSFGERTKTSKLLNDYEIPQMFKDDLFRYSLDKRRPPHRWFVFGPERSGTGIHIDPLGTSAWNALILGHKRWCLIHPNAPKNLIKPQNNLTGKHPDEAISWFNTIFNEINTPSFNDLFPTYHAVQYPGEIMFVPSGWWHVVVNIDTTIAITQNFCSISNLDKVWPKTLKGRPKFSTHWLRRLYKERPEIFKMIQEINNRLNYTNLLNLHEEYSSDSSSSSSSSSDCSDSDDESTTSIKDNNNKSPINNDKNIISSCYQEQFTPKQTLLHSPTIKQNDLFNTDCKIAEVPVWTNNDKCINRKRKVSEDNDESTNLLICTNKICKTPT